jgi:hypothetical protein
MTVVTIPFVAASVELLMIAVDEAVPFTVEVSVLTAEARSLVLMNCAVVVAVLPLTTEVRTNELVEVAIVKVLEVDDATRLVRSVVVATPFTVVVRIVPVVERAFEEITEEVAVIPLIVVVKVLPERDCVKELMIDASEEVTPLTIVWKRFADEDAVFEVMILVVPVEPPTFEVRILAEEESVFVVARLVTVRLVVVALVVVSVVKVASVARRSAVKKLPVEVALVNDEVMAERTVEKRLDEVAVVL